MINLDQLSSIFGIVAAGGGVILSAINYIRYLEGQLESFRSKLKLQGVQIDAALTLLDHRVRNLEKFTENNSNFKVRHQRDDQTGSPFLDS